jgi:hypothetical protein
MTPPRPRDRADASADPIPLFRGIVASRHLLAISRSSRFADQALEGGSGENEEREEIFTAPLVVLLSGHAHGITLYVASNGVDIVCNFLRGSLVSTPFALKPRGRALIKP